MTSKRSDSPTTSLAAGTIGPDAGAEVTGHIEEIAEMTPEFAAKPARSRTALSRNKELARAEKMRREFSANVSHEMKTPLQVISGYAELMANGLVPPEDVPRFAQLIYEEAQAMRALIDDVLVLSRLDEVAPAAEEATAVDIAVVAHHVVQRLAKLAADAGVTVALRTDPVIIQGNETLLEQLIYNLVENAIRYNREEGRVFVEVYEEDVLANEMSEGGDVLADEASGREDATVAFNHEENAAVPTAVIRVNDTGAGIPADKLEKIFERFYRLEKSRSKELGGTGLGLAIVKHAALYHGGDVTVESEEDAGTRFTVRLPLS
ncbi:sensor histidine kinase [Adlercreutzia shanghongiae]|uniref:Sensor-like histidine kinase SenX3 n=1 Tax=Adlercreutzia shanghongiae TaxID=3111773 RepID=A0ABU6IV54_9ACTN|nr:ATP-binding protein [Adlercreutzia sp. R22]MEC4293711.1 ATP-binding protein [Adlercreutzia sp. R22]